MIKEEEKLPKPDDMDFNELIRKIMHGEILIPRFQRDFVWKLEDTAKLLDSIVKGYPIGAFTFWSTQERMANIKELGGHLIQAPKSRVYINYVLDGQQRLASLFVAFTGSIHKKKDYKKIFVNLDDLKENDEEPIISKEQKEKSVSIYDLLTIDSLDFKPRFPDIKILKRIQKYKKIFDKYRFSIIKLEGYELNEAVEIFTRINTSGTVLSLFQIMVAKTYDEKKKFDMQKEYDKLKNTLAGLKFDTLQPRNLLNLLGLIIDGDCRRDAILKLDKEKIIDFWDDAKSSFEHGIDFIRNHLEIPASKILPYDSLIVPISYFYYKNKFQDPNSNQINLLKQYFWKVALSERFSSATTSKLNEDAKKIDTIVKNQAPSYDFKALFDKEEIIKKKFRTGSSFCKAILCLYAQQNPRSFKDNSIINLNNSALKRSNSINYHHFFPKSWLKKAHVKNWNSIVNITYTNDRLNKSILDDPPSKYINKFRKDNPSMDMEKILKTHLIEDIKTFGIENDDYDTFLNQRGERIYKELMKKIQ